MDEIAIKKLVHKKIIINMTILLFLLTAVNSLCAYFNSFTGDNGTRAEVNLNNSVITENKKLIQYGSIPLLWDEYGRSNISYLCEVDSILTGNGIASPVKVDLTDNTYIAFSGLKITRGTYFSDDAVENGRNVAVISEQMAAGLFKSLNVIGSEIELFNERYKIVGLYGKSESIVSIFGSDGYDRVYAPFTSYNGIDTLPVNTIFIKSSNQEEEKYKQHQILNFLTDKLNIDAGLYKIMDYGNTSTILSQPKAIFIFFIAIWGIWLSMNIAAACLKKSGIYLKKCLEDLYFGELLKIKKMHITGLVLSYLIFIGLIICFFIAAKPDIYIPAQYIPQDNIFDISFYINKARSAIQALNTTQGYIPTNLEKIKDIVLTFNMMLLLFTIPIFISFVSGLRMYKATGCSAKILVKLGLISCIAAFIPEALFSLAGGVGLVFPIGNFFIVLIFSCNYYINRCCMVYWKSKAN